MRNLTLTEAFARFQAVLTNSQWAVSSISANGELVISCWAHYFFPHDGKLRYRDRLSRWSGNRPGNNLLKAHLIQALQEHLPIRLVMARAEDTGPIDEGEDASKVAKTFGVREDLVGTLIEFDGDELVIDFDKVSSLKSSQ